ncbi:MAG: hypothetical protein WBV73_10585 [Phormidium sp.]
MLKYSQKTGLAFLFLSAFLGSALSSSAQVPEAACSTFIRQGRTLNWITMINGLPVNRGVLTISQVPQTGRWSGRQVNQTSGNITIDVGGQFDGSTVSQVNPAFSETWDGRCNVRGIGGRVNGNSNVTFVMW